jgi:hypothetical protein
VLWNLYYQKSAFGYGFWVEANFFGWLLAFWEVKASWKTQTKGALIASLMKDCSEGEMVGVASLPYSLPRCKLNCAKDESSVSRFTSIGSRFGELPVMLIRHLWL